MAPNETMFVSSEVAATKHSLASNLHNIKLNKKKNTKDKEEIAVEYQWNKYQSTQILTQSNTPSLHSMTHSNEFEFALWLFWVFATYSDTEANMEWAKVDTATVKARDKRKATKSVGRKKGERN